MTALSHNSVPKVEFGFDPPRRPPDHVDRSERSCAMLTPHRRQSRRVADAELTCELLWRWHVNRDREARAALVTEFLPLAQRVARRYQSPDRPLEDLVQVASIGLLEAIDRFDPARGVSFVRFAVPTILGELKRHFRQTGWSTHVPRRAQELALQVERARRDLFAASGQAPEVVQIAEHLGISLEQALLGLEAATARYTRSLDAPRSDEGVEGRPLVESLATEEAGLGLIEAKLSIAAAVPCLPYLERRAFTLRAASNLKQAEIAAEMGCSQMQVSRLLRRAAEHLRELTQEGEV